MTIFKHCVANVILEKVICYEKTRGEIPNNNFPVALAFMVFVVFLMEENTVRRDGI